ncbi:UNKNOWN [Stylonychia lemnae]|uniref:Uncharacterized protein n=1 Tax=Stylonychia lemnae TaxID=5949 RepID=A0A078B1M1_STYLE|nr:UNKNOWN [Stylonychia lemnae]|eukprot:CDW87178.1 UNKNOWN [Stylonychia lemnae]
MISILTSTKFQFSRASKQAIQKTKTDVQELELQKFATPSDRELYLLMKSFDMTTQDPFTIVESVLKFTVQQDYAVSEDFVQKNLEFFANLQEKIQERLVELNLELDQAIQDHLSVDDLKAQRLDQQLGQVIQFSYAMNYDDEGLWAKIYNAVQKLQKLDALTFDGVVSINFVLAQLKKDQNYELLAENQLIELQNGFKNYLLNLIADFDSKTTDDLMKIFRVGIKVLNIQENEEFFSCLDRVIGDRVDELSLDEFTGITGIIQNHNLTVDDVDPISLDLFLMKGEDFITKNLNFLQKDQILSVIGAYCSTELIKQMPDLERALEKEILTRTQTLTSFDIAYLVKVISDAKAGSAEFYAAMDKYIGNHMNSIEAENLFPILRAFYDSGKARNKIFIKLQPHVLRSLDQLDLNQIMSIARLYFEMAIEQTTFYENIAAYAEQHLDKLQESGLVNGLISFKKVQTQRQLPIVVDLEKILMSNMDSLGPSSIFQLLNLYSGLDKLKGHSKLLQALATQSIKLLNEIKRSGQLIGSADVLMLLQSYEKMQAKLETISLVANDIPAQVHLYNDNDLQFLYTYLSGYQKENNGFDKAFFAVRDEVNSRKENFEVEGY